MLEGRHAHPDQPRSASYDRDVLMERMESDVELIRSLVAVFEADRPMLLSDVATALEADDADALERAAHTLKGAVGVFGAEPSRARAERIERMGRDGVVGEARQEYVELEREVLALEEDLKRLVEELGEPD